MDSEITNKKEIKPETIDVRCDCQFEKNPNSYFFSLYAIMKCFTVNKRNITICNFLYDIRT